MLKLHIVVPLHKMGAAMTCLVASAYPERVQFTALIENLGPITRKVQEGPAQLRLYVRQMKTLADKRLPQYTSVAEAELARRAADKNLTEDGARALVRRGLKSVAPSATAIGGATTAFAWRTDPQLMTVPGLSYSEEQTLAVLEAIRCPTVLM